MGTGEVLTATIFVLGLVSSLIALYIKMVTDAALASQKHAYLEVQVEKLENRVNNIEDNALKKIDMIQDMIHKMDININTILNKY